MPTNDPNVTAANLTNPDAPDLRLKPTLNDVMGGVADPEARLREAEEYGAPIVVRLQATVLVNGAHKAMSGVRWSADFPSAESVRGFLRDTEGFFREWFAARQGEK